MLDIALIEAIEKYGIPREGITVERLLNELKSKAVGFRMNDYDEENWEAGFCLGEDWSTIHKQDPLQLLALSYCAICAHEFHEAVNRLNKKINLVKSRKNDDQNLHLQTLPGGKEQGESEYKEANQTLP